jgi:hypothetical protein
MFDVVMMVECHKWEPLGISHLDKVQYELVARHLHIFCLSSARCLVLISRGPWHHMTAVVCAKAVATGSVLCLVKGRDFVSSSLDQVQGHKASGSFHKLHANTAAMANREGGVAIRLALTGTSRTAVIQYSIKDFAQTFSFTLLHQSFDTASKTDILNMMDAQMVISVRGFL